MHKEDSSMKRKLLVVLGVAAAPFVVSPTALATPTGTSECPASTSGYISWDTSTDPYQVDNAVDRNGNGVACAKPTKFTFVLDGVTYVIYNFIDDVLR